MEKNTDGEKNMGNLVLGIDDSGRGPLIGPMILAGILVDAEQETLLKKEGVADSKTILHPKRIVLAKTIKQNSYAHHITKTFPTELDNSLQTGTNLNTLEAKKVAEIINEINKGKYLKEKIKVIIDCPSVNTTAWKNTLIKFITNTSNLIIYCEHKADVNHVSVSAASILAKVTREEEVAKLKEKYGDLGSGYPSDPTTKAFLKAHGHSLSNAGIFRKTWSTWKKLFPNNDEKQTKLF